MSLICHFHVMQVTDLKHEAHPSSASAVIQSTYQSIEDIHIYSEEDIDAINLETLSIDFSHPQKGDTEVGNVSAREIVEVMRNATFDRLTTECPRVMLSIDVDIIPMNREGYNQSLYVIVIIF